MRRAQIAHAWEQCRLANKKRLDVRKLLVHTDDGVFEITIPGRVAALLGENGSGKTSVLKAIRNSAAGLSDLTPGYASSVGVEARFQGADVVWDAPPPAEAVQRANVQYLDVAADVHTIRQQISNEDLDEYIQQFGRKTLSADELGSLKFVAGRNYRAVGIREVEATTEPAGVGDINEGDAVDEEIFPFFDVELHDGTKYDSRTMGLGELCACLLTWRLGQIPKGTLLLLDEPDSHLSPKSRLNLTDYLANIAHDKESWILFTSHSPEPIQKLKETEILLIDRIDTPSAHRLDIASNKHDAAIRLGMTLSPRFLLAVEDDDAKEAVGQIIGKFAPQLGGLCEITVVPGGADRVVLLDGLFPRSSRVCELITILDGDKRAQFGEQAQLLFLPSELDPIVAARGSENARPTVWAVRLNVAAKHLERSMALAANVNHHDYCAELSRQLAVPAIDELEIRRALMSAWISSPAGEGAFKELAHNLYERIKQIGMF